MVIIKEKAYAPKGTMIKDILSMINMSYPQIHTPLLIMYRVFWNGDTVDDTLAGYCEWDGEKLKSLDGDSYGLYDEVVTYEIVQTDKQQYMLIVTY